MKTRLLSYACCYFTLTFLIHVGQVRLNLLATSIFQVLLKKVLHKQKGKVITKRSHNQIQHENHQTKIIPHISLEM